MTDSIISPPFETEQKIPVISIIGRPNVGKSTLFNRLVGKRRAITDPTPGVTRDAISERWYLEGHPVTLIDSGGIKYEREGLDDLVTERSMSLLEKSDAIIFLMEAGEISSEDEELLSHLRPYAEKLVLVVNKIDDPKHQDLVWEFFAYGYQRVLGISAAHGHGIGELEEILLELLGLTPREQAEEAEPAIRLSIMGKPNTGKSTLANLLVGDEISIVSDIAGTTRDVVSASFVYKGTEFKVLDTAGIRRKSKVDEDVEYYSVNRAIKTIDESDVVLLVVDAVEGLSEQDKKIAALIVRRGKGIILVLNKSDLLSGVANEQTAIKDRVRFLFPILSFAPITFISALKGIDIGKMLDTVWSVWRQLNRRVETARLNEAIAQWGETTQPPRDKSGYFKVYYGTQTSSNPVRFLFFVNRIKGFPQSYVQYLKNCIRRDLGFDSIPIEIDLRERKRNPSLHERGVKRPIEEEVKKPVKQPVGGGRAVAKPKARKPGNLASLDKRRKRQDQEQQRRGRRAPAKKRG
ncbi:MAG TPA: ribosome biogenesis GTPase Der [Sphaerochaeta sp.]|jgi:GTP-binding protein|nr:ribosome biogenesis GTPase Der [Spirochaetota bacterium]NLV60497.1 ribosome biogenesis GTPase Der [Spirochaetales bacterium]HOE83974.1 ribosome biogenesis GTPase Der [Sphaerochaeta sp.]HOQ94044.1 ribosome biogenesis GTPase Der [Sphaerochaeta sp.]HPK46778.1 ribosome biogenesis GTPase Der [Sphaerochaeta sp.]